MYDNRVRESERRADIYLDPNCEDIVGGPVKKVLEIPGQGAAAPKNPVVAPEPGAATADKADSQDGDSHGGRKSPEKQM